MTKVTIVGLLVIVIIPNNSTNLLLSQIREKTTPRVRLHTVLFITNILNIFYLNKHIFNFRIQRQTIKNMLSNKRNILGWYEIDILSIKSIIRRSICQPRPCSQCESRPQCRWPSDVCCHCGSRERLAEAFKVL